MSASNSKIFKFPKPFDTQYHDPNELGLSQDDTAPLNNNGQQLDAEQQVSDTPQEKTGDTGFDNGNDEQQMSYNPPPPEETTSSRGRIKKRLIVCCDGTGQSASNGISSVPTNITRLARAFDTSDQFEATETEPASETPQIVLYQTGIGTEEVSQIGSSLSSAFGYGVDRHILEAYTFFSLNYEEEDELFLFGISRGAFTARAIASLVCNVGLLTKDCLDRLPMIYARYKQRHASDASRNDLENWIKKRVKNKHGKVEINDPDVKEKEKFTINKSVVIAVMGLFDTVGSLGIPEGNMSTLLKPLSWLGFDNTRYQYHDTSFPVATCPADFRAHIETVYQILAIDECRTSFTPTLLYDHGTKSTIGRGTSFHQIWIPGVHTDVGGGYEREFRDISDISFACMYDILKHRLRFREGVAMELEPSTLDPARLDQAPSLWTRLTRRLPKLPEIADWAESHLHDEYHTLKFKFGGQRYRSPGQYYLKQGYDKGDIFHTSEWIHPSVRVRLLRVPDWKPPALHGFTLVRDKVDTFSWTRECEIPGKGSVHLQLDEWRISPEDQTQEDIKDARQVNMESFVLDKQTKALLLDPEAFEELSEVVGEKSGWLKWLMAW